jgi:ferredoxin
MPDNGSQLITLMHRRLAAAGVCDGDGIALDLRSRRAPLVIGRVCDDQPLMATEVTLARLMPDRVVGGLGAAAMLCGAQRMVLAVDENAPEAIRLLKRETQGTKVELVLLPGGAPLDPISLALDVVQLQGWSAMAAHPAQTLVLDASTLCSMAEALQGRLPYRRTVTIAGQVREPAVVQAPLGTGITDLVEACGGCPDQGWVPFLCLGRGRQRADGQQVIDERMRGVIILPHDHALVRQSTVPLGDHLKRAAASCTHCRSCTDHCPVQLNGGHLQPHQLMQVMTAPREVLSTTPQSDPQLLSSLECLGCGLCSVGCPARLDPSALIGSVASRLQLQGVEFVTEFIPHSHPDRLGRRLTVRRLEEMLGLAIYRRELQLKTGQVIPRQIAVPLRGPQGSERIPTVRVDEKVAPGDVVALAAAGSGEPDRRAAVGGRVIRVDPDDGVIIQTI